MKKEFEENEFDDMDAICSIFENLVYNGGENILPEDRRELIKAIANYKGLNNIARSISQVGSDLNETLRNEELSESTFNSNKMISEALNRIWYDLDNTEVSNYLFKIGCALEQLIEEKK